MRSFKKTKLIAVKGFIEQKKQGSLNSLSKSSSWPKLHFVLNNHIN